MHNTLSIEQKDNELEIVYKFHYEGDLDEDSNAFGYGIAENEQLGVKYEGYWKDD